MLGMVSIGDVVWVEYIPMKNSSADSSGRVPHLHQILLLILIAPTIQVILLGILGYSIKYPNWYLV